MDYRFANQTIFTHTTGQIAEARDEVYIVAGNNLVAEKYVESTNTWERKIILLVCSVRTKKHNLNDKGRSESDEYCSQIFMVYRIWHGLNAQ